MSRAEGYPGPTEPMIGALLRLASEASHGLLLDRLHAHGFGDVRPAHFALFQYPGPHGARPTDLAARINVTKQALNPLLNELEALGYLTREPNDGDRRGRVLRLTDRGMAFVAATKGILEEMQQELIDRLGARRFALVRSALVDIADTFQSARQLGPG